MSRESIPRFATTWEHSTAREVIQDVPRKLTSVVTSRRPTSLTRWFLYYKYFC